MDYFIPDLKQIFTKYKYRLRVVGSVLGCILICYYAVYSILIHNLYSSATQIQTNTLCISLFPPPPPPTHPHSDVVSVLRWGHQNRHISILRIYIYVQFNTYCISILRIYIYVQYNTYCISMSIHGYTYVSRFFRS